MGRLSGGEAVLTALSAQFLRSIGITRWLRLERTGRIADTGPL